VKVSLEGAVTGSDFAGSLLAQARLAILTEDGSGVAPPTSETLAFALATIEALSYAFISFYARY
jgi:hypothetical protein